MTATKKNKQIVKSLSLHPLQAYLTDTVQLFDIVEQILKQTGAASLIVTSFSISEEFVRRMHRLKQREVISDMDLIIDMRAAKKIANLMPFANNVFDNIYLASNHSKVLLISNEEYKVSVCTSQNQTRGNRNESGIISTNNDVFVTYSKAVERLTKQAINVNNIFK